jgi:bifunctional UDP-N-acetylglucosamine pyrophosphorylase/glucosamine-1-phosphate N-acetyltransferase
MREDVTVVVLAAGLGTRMKSRRAKVLHEAGGDTLLNHVLRAALKVARPERIVTVVGYDAQKVRDSVAFEGIRFAEQPEQNGTAHAVLCAREAVTSERGQLLILNGDGPLLKGSTLEALIEVQDKSRAAGSIATTRVPVATGYGRIVRDDQGRVAEIVEQRAATPEQLNILEINAGLYCFDASLFWKYIPDVTPDNPAREYYLTDIVGILARHGESVVPMLLEDNTELLGINTRVELAVADRILRTRKVEELMLSGATVEYPESVTIDAGVEIGQDSLIQANVQLRGRTRIGARCVIGTGSVLRDCEVSDDVTVLPYVIADASAIRAHAVIGPFARMRMNAEAGESAHIGNFVELKKTRLGRGSKANHLAYLGDSLIGAQVNIGAGTITCNYDGERKHETRIADGVFVGSNSTIVAPLKISEGAYIAAGSVLTRDVEADSLALGRAQQVDKPGWAKKRRDSKNRP